MTTLLTTDSTDKPAAEFVAGSTRVLTTFDRTQDSGNVSWLVGSPSGRLFFCKSAGTDGDNAVEPPPYFDHAGRVVLLRNAITLATSCDHPTLARLRKVIETGTGPLLVYDAAPGELIHVARTQRSDPLSAYRRFGAASASVRLRIFDQLLDAHVALAHAGWVACDLYDGCLIVDADRLTLIDLDTYHRGSFVNTMGRMFGSTTFMAPEEFELGAAIDLRTTVFTLGRLIWHFGTGISERAADFCGTAAQAHVVQKACAPDPAHRWPHPETFAAAWTEAG